MTFGLRTTSFGLPSTSTLPRSSTMARSTSGITISMTCSTISTVTPVSRTRRTSSTHVGARGETGELQDLMRLAARLAHGLAAHQRTDDDIVDHAHGLEALDHLEGAADAALAAFSGRHPGDVLAVEPDRAFGRPHHARDQVEHG